MDDIDRINEMRKINYNLDDRLDDYNKNVTELKNQLESGNINARDFQKSLEHLIEKRLRIAEQLGRYDQLATKGEDKIGGPSQTGQVARARTLLQGGLVDFSMDADRQKLFDGYLKLSLESKGVINAYSDELKELSENTEKRDKYSAGSDGAVTGVRNRDAEKYFERDIKVKGDQRAVSEYKSILQALLDRSQPQPAPAVLHEAGHTNTVESDAPAVVQSEETFTTSNTPPPPPKEEDPSKLTRDDIKGIQEQLKALHFKVDVTGEMDRRTQIAFRAFTWDLQAVARKNGHPGLGVNGIFDEKTMAALTDALPDGFKTPTRAEDKYFHGRAVRAGDTDSQYAQALYRAARAMNLSDNGKLKNLADIAVGNSVTAEYNLQSDEATIIRQGTLLNVSGPLVTATQPMTLSTLFRQFNNQNFDAIADAHFKEYERKAATAFNAAGGADLTVNPDSREDLKKALVEINNRGGFKATDAELNMVVDGILQQRESMRQQGVELPVLTPKVAAKVPA
jgi:hypothetical protein